MATHYLDCGNEVSISPGVTRGKGEVGIFLINEQREDNKGHNKVDATTDDSRKRHKPINCAVFVLFGHFFLLSVQVFMRTSLLKI